MPTPQPLAHLSEEELLELMSRYYAGERVATLLEDYRVNCSASTLCNHFPPEPSAELCRYCNAPMVRPRRSKSWSSESTLRCSQCAHFESSRCSCPGCKAERLREEDLLIRQQHTKIQQFCSANWGYSPTQIQPEWIRPCISGHRLTLELMNRSCGGTRVAFGIRARCGDETRCSARRRWPDFASQSARLVWA